MRQPFFVSRPTFARIRARIAWATLTLLVLSLVAGAPSAQAQFVSVVDSQGVSAGTNETGCSNSNDGHGGFPDPCTFSDPGPSIRRSYSVTYTDPLFGNTASATSAVTSGQYTDGVIFEVQLNPKIGGTATAKGPNTDIIDSRAGFSASFTDRMHFGGGATDLPGRVVLRIRLTGDVFLGSGLSALEREYNFEFAVFDDGGHFELEAFYHASNEGSDHTIRGWS